MSSDSKNEIVSSEKEGNFYMGNKIKDNKFERMLERGDKVRINGINYKVTFVDKSLGKMFLKRE